ncbi:MAG: lytic transglycosylase domain-containing protein [Leifsonia sp.]
MGRHSEIVTYRPAAVAVPAASPAPAPARVAARPASVRPVSRSRSVLTVFAFAASAAFVLVNIVDPYSGATASPYFQMPSRATGAEQALRVAASEDVVVSRDGYTVTAKPEPEPVVVAQSHAPSAGVPDPGTAKAIGYEMVMARGWSEEEYNCLVALWDRESHWNVNAHNSSSGAHGIPQALPGSKMATAGADWETNPATQITWGLGYITGRYGSACGAWAHSEDAGWY